VVSSSMLQYVSLLVLSFHQRFHHQSTNSRYGERAAQPRSLAPWVAQLLLSKYMCVHSQLSLEVSRLSTCSWTRHLQYL
jgi:hypothetical protein